MNDRRGANEILPLKEWGKEYGRQLEDLSKLDAENLVEISRKIGQFLIQGSYLSGKGKKRMNLKVNQLRRFLTAARRVESDLKRKKFKEIKDNIIFLRPKLAYAAGREEQAIPLHNVLDPAIQSGAESRENFLKLLRLIEGIIAYHRFYGGTN